MSKQSAWELFCKTGHPVCYSWYSKEKQRMEQDKKERKRVV